jgi:hypothetical protein
LFAAVNIGFRKAYTRLVERFLSKLGDTVPVVILIGDDATLLRDARNSVTKSDQTDIMNLRRSGTSHSASNLLMTNGSGRLGELRVSGLHEKRAQIREARTK